MANETDPNVNLGEMIAEALAPAVNKRLTPVRKAAKDATDKADSALRTVSDLATGIDDLRREVAEIRDRPTFDPATVMQAMTSRLEQRLDEMEQEEPQSPAQTTEEQPA